MLVCKYLIFLIGSSERREDHALEQGWYSEAVMAFSLRWKVAHNELGTAAGWKLDLDDPVQPNAQSLIRLHAECALGLVVNQNNAHWTAIRWEQDVYWLLDSCKASPIRMTPSQTLAYLQRYRHAFLVLDHIRTLEEAQLSLTMAPSLNDGALPVDSTSKPSGLEPAGIGAPVNADVAFNQNERALEIRCANCGRLGHASNVDPRCPFHGRERGQIEWAPHHPDSALGDNVPHMSETRICIFANGVKQSSSQRRPFWYPAVVVSSIDLSCFCRASHKSLNKQQIDIEGVPRGSIIQSNIQRRLTESPRITNM